MELLAKAVPVALLVFVVSSMLAVGLGLTVAQILAPLRNARLVTLALVANFVLMPLAALLIARVFRLDQPLGVALLLLGGAAGAPFLPKLAGVAKGESRLRRGPDGAAHGAHGGLHADRHAAAAGGRVGRSHGDRPLADPAHAAAAGDRTRRCGPALPAPRGGRRRCSTGSPR